MWRRYRYSRLCWCIPNRIKLMINGMKWRSLTLIIVSKGLFWGWEKINLVIDLIMIHTKLSFIIHFDWNFKTHNYILSLLYVRFSYVCFITPLKLLCYWASRLPWLQNSSFRCWSPWNPKIITYSIRVKIIVEQATQRNICESSTVSVCIFRVSHKLRECLINYERVGFVLQYLAEWWKQQQDIFKRCCSQVAIATQAHSQNRKKYKPAVIQVYYTWSILYQRIEMAQVYFSMVIEVVKWHQLYRRYPWNFWVKFFMRIKHFFFLFSSSLFLTSTVLNITIYIICCSVVF